MTIVSSTIDRRKPHLTLVVVAIELSAMTSFARLLAPVGGTRFELVTSVV